MSFWNLFCWCDKRDKDVQEEKSEIKVTFIVNSGRIIFAFLFFKDFLRKQGEFSQSVIIFIIFISCA